MSRKIPSNYYKYATLAVWALAIVCVASTWIGFTIPSTGATVFAALIDVALFLVGGYLSLIMILNEDKKYQKKGYVFCIFALIHLIFFVLVLSLQGQIAEGSKGSVYVAPAIHTVILVGLAGFGLYFWFSSDFVIGSSREKKMSMPLDNQISQPSNTIPSQPTQPVQQEPKQETSNQTRNVVDL